MRFITCNNFHSNYNIIHRSIRKVLLNIQPRTRRYIMNGVDENKTEHMSIKDMTAF